MSEAKKPKQTKKTLDELIYDLKENITKVINESGLPLSVTAMMIREAANELTQMEMNQAPKK